MLHPVPGELQHFFAFRKRLGESRKSPGGIFSKYLARYLKIGIGACHAEKEQDVVTGETVPCAGAAVQKRQSVADRAVSVGRKKRERVLVCLHIDLFAYASEEILYGLFRNAPEIEPYAARKYRSGELVGIRGAKNEYSAGRGLFQRLEKRVESLRGEHVDFVYDVDLGAAGDRREVYFLAQGADVVHGVVGRGVHLDNVYEIAGSYGSAAFADAAGALPFGGAV